jgi:hypothetical protein|tara:strand:- start:81 stop:359 length:279 start_codon:yes stop_codon:yes gene_type:complete
MSILWNQKEEEFYVLCDMFNLTYPDVSKTEGDNLTTHYEVKFNEETDVMNLFSHFLVDYHTMEPDRIADIISDLVSHKKADIAVKHNMGLYR